MSNLSISSRSSNSFPISACFMGAGDTLMRSVARKVTLGSATLLTSRMYSPAAVRVVSKHNIKNILPLD